MNGTPLPKMVSVVHYAYPNVFGTSQTPKPLAAHCRQKEGK